MFRSTILAFGILASSAATAASSTAFAECGQAGAQRLYSYDAGSVQRRGANVAVRLKADYSRVPGSQAATARIQWLVDCGRKSFVEKARSEYASSGRIVAQYRPTHSMGINPGSVAEKLFQRVCV